MRKWVSNNYDVDPDSVLGVQVNDNLQGMG